MKEQLLDIETQDDIKLLVDSFYKRVNDDELLGPVFNNVAKVNWEKHLPKMYQFWGTQLIGTMDYVGAPFPPHAKLPITKKHFDRWLSLFIINVDMHFSGATANVAKQKAKNIAKVFQLKLAET